MPRKLGPRHAKSKRVLATVNRLASAANDIRRLVWHDHQTADGEAPSLGVFAFSQTVDRQAARALVLLWSFTRQLSSNFQMTPAEIAAARRAVEVLYQLDTQQPNVRGRSAVISGREYEAVMRAFDEIDGLPQADVARAISGILARVARWRCNWNSNAAYAPRVDERGTVWSAGALWNPPVSIAEVEQQRLKKKYGDRLPVKAAPELELKQGGGQPAAAPPVRPAAQTFVSDDLPGEFEPGLRGLGKRKRALGSIFALPRRRAKG